MASLNPKDLQSDRLFALYLVGTSDKLREEDKERIMNFITGANKSEIREIVYLMQSKSTDQGYLANSSGLSGGFLGYEPYKYQPWETKLTVSMPEGWGRNVLIGKSNALENDKKRYDIMKDLDERSRLSFPADKGLLSDS